MVEKWNKRRRCWENTEEQRNLGDFKQKEMNDNIKCKECGGEMMVLYTGNVNEQLGCVDCGYRKTRKIKTHK